MRTWQSPASEVQRVALNTGETRETRTSSCCGGTCSPGTRSQAIPPMSCQNHCDQSDADRCSRQGSTDFFTPQDFTGALRFGPGQNVVIRPLAIVRDRTLPLNEFGQSSTEETSITETALNCGGVMISYRRDDQHGHHDKR